MSNIAIFLRDHFCATRDALVANLAAVGADDTEDFASALATERAVAVTHGIPQRRLGAVKPRFFNSGWRTVKVFAGNFFRSIQFQMTDGLPVRLVSSATALGPSSFSITASMVSRCCVMSADHLSQCVIDVNNHNMELDGSRIVDNIEGMGQDSKYPFEDQGRRLRLLRQAEGVSSGAAFARKVGWPQSGVSQFETGMRQLTTKKVLELSKVIPGFNPMWLWHGDKSVLSFDLRRRIEAEEAKEALSLSVRSER